MAERFLRLPKVIAVTGLSRATIWRMEHCGNFPPRYQLGQNSVGWRESQINTWLDSRPQRRESGLKNDEVGADDSGEEPTSLARYAKKPMLTR